MMKFLYVTQKITAVDTLKFHQLLILAFSIHHTYYNIFNIDILNSNSYEIRYFNKE